MSAVGRYDSPGCKGNDFYPTLSSRGISSDQPHGGSLHLALATGDLVQATSSGLTRSRPLRGGASSSARPFAFNGTIGTTKVA
jgi:hypothetical protein